ncbi:MAG TPA: CoA pyrophosphatase [Paludibacter sp.]|nr:CoA pyrophosphatase [Paludibacter sp.]
MIYSKEYIKQKLSGSLPGMDAHLRMAPASRARELENVSGKLENARKSAVMMLFFGEAEDLKMIVIRRSNYVGIHAGQIAFPGGRYEEGDGDVQETAYRELEEEIGITRDKIELLGRLTDIYVPPSNFLISIFVGYLEERPLYKIQDREVAEVIEVPLQEFFSPNVVKFKDFYVSSLKAAANAPYFDVTNAEIWGASAMVISELLELLKEGRLQ